MKDGGFVQNNWPNMRYTNKKGISTLVSVVLLVSFVIVMGLIVTNWSTKLIKRNIESSETKVGTDLECLNVNVKLTPSESVKEDVVTSDFVIFVENNNLKDKEISGFISRFDIGNTVFVDYKYQGGSGNQIEAFNAKAMIFSYAQKRNTNPIPEYDDYFIPGGNFNPQILKSIEVIPQITLDNGGVVDCVKKAAKYTF